MITKPENLTFNYRPGDTILRPRPEEETFATTEAAAEPRDWGYFGLLAFTTVLLLRPQDRVPSLTSLHVAEICWVVVASAGTRLVVALSQRIPGASRGYSASPAARSPAWLKARC